MEDFAATCRYFTRKLGRVTTKVLHPLFRTFVESFSLVRTRGLYSVSYHLLQSQAIYQRLLCSVSE